MTRTTRFRAVRAAIAALTAAGLALVAATPAMADPPVVLGNFSAPDYTFIISQEDTNPHWFEVDVTNMSAAPITFGLGGALSELGVMEYLWTQELDPSSGSDQFSETILPGESYHDQIPNWPGVEYGFFADINTTPELIGSWTVDGPFFPVEWSDADDEVAAFQFGYPVALVPSTARAGEQLSISADIGTLGVAAADVRIAPVAELFIQFNGEWDWDADAATPLGSIPVTNGVASGSLTLPADLAPGEYGLLLGDAANDWWIAGPGITFDTLANTQTYTGALVIEAGPPRGATPAGTDVSVMPVDNNGNQPVSFVFDSVGTPGTTTVTTSTTGPTPAGFELQGVYYELSTDAGFSGDVTVCITYDAQGATTPLSLFHFEAGTWVDITDLGMSTPGHTCGVTDVVLAVRARCAAAHDLPLRRVLCAGFEHEGEHRVRRHHRAVPLLARWRPGQAGHHVGGVGRLRLHGRCLSSQPDRGDQRRWASSCSTTGRAAPTGGSGRPKPTGRAPAAPS